MSPIDPTGKATDTAPIGIYWHPQTLNDARAAYALDIEQNETGPETFALWIADAIDRYAQLTPQQRADIVDTLPNPARAGEGLNRPFIVPLETIHAAEDACKMDQGALGKNRGISTLAYEAARAKTEQARAANGGTLAPAGPGRLPTRARARQRRRR
ncbi:hypothetical protein [Rudaeicoccus suwonensis]|uniref:Uncharacterized protein n=1 Tax=Rudaeicoccus suwonensis TaxID=657409 RepID=A0A561DVG1_9MICO|nr:hypothetical protein [Rudaeicoccus suwonensis]TWE07347.1 hypothetical protein BKA23_3360 [Rudaeicoccus suwonensis]